VVTHLTIDTSSLRESKWHEYAIRFIFGGLTTVAAGFIAKHYGPVIGGLFLAFPSIFPASLTLVAKHERLRKDAQGEDGLTAGKLAASEEAIGTSAGSIGLLAFGAIAWWLLPEHKSWLVLATASIGWMITSILVWLIGRSIAR
jgi:hypothetical protein